MQYSWINMKKSLFRRLILSELKHPSTVLSVNDSTLCSEISDLIFNVEKTIGLGYLLCLNSLLYQITVLPIKSILSYERKYSLRFGIILGISIYFYLTINVSRLYHDLKEQDFIKLSAVYNMFQVADSLISNFGKKTIRALFSAHTIKLSELVVLVIYLFLHTLLLCLQVVVYEVALNSSTSTLLLLLTTTSFVELKASVFKKTDHKIHFGVLCGDILDRLQLSLYFFIIYTEAAVSNRENTSHLLKGILVATCTIVTIDWIKHYFILYFNKLPVSIYERDFKKLRMINNVHACLLNNTHSDMDDIVVNSLDWCTSLTLSYKFTCLPHVCLVRST